MAFKINCLTGKEAKQQAGPFCDPCTIGAPLSPITNGSLVVRTSVPAANWTYSCFGQGLLPGALGEMKLLGVMQAQTYPTSHNDTFSLTTPKKRAVDLSETPVSQSRFMGQFGLHFLKCTVLANTDCWDVAPPPPPPPSPRNQTKQHIKTRKHHHQQRHKSKQKQ